MLKRIYINNYKSLVNFELDFNKINLFLGTNGAGKSSIFEVLQKLKLLIADSQRVDVLFPASTRTKWLTATTQTFVLEVGDDSATYKYELTIEHEEKRNLQRVQQEKLSVDQQILLFFEGGTAQLYRDNGSKGPEYPFDWSQSAVASLPERGDNTKLTRFKHILDQLLVIQPIPISRLMRSESAQQTQRPSYHMDDYVSWYRYLSQDSGFVLEFITDLRESLEDFKSFTLEQVGREERALVINFKPDNKQGDVSFDFDEISDGQRMLIILYTLLHLPDHTDSREYPFILCLDEPDNFVTLQEIQPWLQGMYDLCIDNKLQLLLISHNPTAIDYLLMPDADPIGQLFYRDGNLEPTRVKTIDTTDNHLPASELMARGWLDAE